MTMKNIVRLLALVAILTAFALPASAQWGPEEEKNCFLNGKKGTITLSGQVNSAQGDSSKLEQYEEIPEGFLVPCAAYGWSNQDYFLDAKAIDAAAAQLCAAVERGSQREPALAGAAQERS